MRRIPLICASLTSLIVLASTTLLVGGPLNPPAGPVAPTYKTLSEVEPRTAISAANTPGDAGSLFKITQPGSYYLTGNITGVSGKHGIAIAASGVTLDLNGFDLLGVAGSLDGVATTVNGLTNIAVVNGSVRGWGDEGVDCASFSATNCRVSGLLVSGNTGSGIAISTQGIVTGCGAYDNGGNGIAVSTNGLITDCASRTNAGDGVSGGAASTIVRCSVRTNGGNGIVVTAGIGGMIADCCSEDNNLDGIRVGTHTLVTRNACPLNGRLGGDGAGIHATGADNRIEGNDCTGSDRGIDVDLAGNVIIRNTCSGNTINWVIAANNVCGPILDRTAPASAAISGNSAPSSLGSTDANANFTY